MDIYTPEEGKTDIEPVMKSIGKKQGQADELVVNMKGLGKKLGESLGQAISSAKLKFDSVRIVGNDGYDTRIMGEGSALDAPPANSKPQAETVPDGTPCDCEGADGGVGVVDPLTEVMDDIMGDEAGEGA
ncbi:hypothetical protein ACFY0B_03685 [Streptomyces sp. NPDC001797]|uniref:hypothetical protein n=1 Tax=Streptomyces sp. NPDC001797 TaxID=3364610 RepID=UPI003673C732